MNSSMKTCNKCKEELPFSDFHKNKRKKDGYQDYCKLCKKAEDKRYYEANGEKWRAHYRQVGKDNREWFKELKSKESCAKCKDNRYYVLDYHHLDPKEKTIDVTQALNWSRKKVLNEIKKCIPLCSNCHREFHHMERIENMTIDNYLK